MSTTEPMVEPLMPDPVGEGPPSPAPAPRRYWLRWSLAAIAMVLAIGLVGSTFVTLPYYAIAPGSARKVDDLVRVQNGQAYGHEGHVLFTTVSLYQVRLLDAVHSWFDRDIDVVGRKQILGDAKPTQLDQINKQEMNDSKEAAVAVALRRLGAKELGDGALVTQVVGKSPADGHLKSGDVITSISGQATPLSQDAVKVIRAHKPGDAVDAKVKSPDGSERAERFVLSKNPDIPSAEVAFLGVAMVTKNDHFDLPYDVNIDSGRVGGPSAGLAFTLEVLDTLTPGELTGGKKVAITGTIEQDGSVGEVGGVRQKTAAVIAAGAKYFIVPAKEEKQARARAGDKVKIIPVQTLEQALTALASIGGDTSVLPPPPDTLQR